MTAISTARATFTAVAAATAFSGLLASTGLTAAQIRDKILGDRAERSDQVFYRRARDRGEIDLERTPAAVMAMPFDLLRPRGSRRSSTTCSCRWSAATRASRTPERARFRPVPRPGSGTRAWSALGLPAAPHGTCKGRLYSRSAVVLLDVVPLDA
jgi:hypothetical protein